MTKTIVILAALASTTLFANAASAHGRGSNTSHSTPGLVVGVGAKVGGRSGLLSVGAGVHTPVANVGLGVQALGHGQLLSLDLGAFNGGVGH
jgi:hypothetical protein